MAEFLADVLAEVLSEDLPTLLSDASIELLAETVVRMVIKCNPVSVPPVDPRRVVVLLPSLNGADDN